ncbi:MAG: ribosome silencing factor [Pyrinomonadaceae bacterium]
MKHNSSIKEQSLNPQVAARTQAQADAVADQIDDHVLLALHATREKKALDVVLLDLREIASFTDFFLLTSGANERQVQAISDEVYESLKRQGIVAARVEGYKTAEWVLLDYGDFVVHVFERKARSFYDLERLWREAKRVALPEESDSTPNSSLRRES